ncbi:MAG: histidinol dehydrogenase [Kineosporiaceae bacterium]
MLRTMDLRGQRLDHRRLRGVVPRAATDVDAVLAVVRPVCDDVRERGAAALLDLTERFDGVRPPHLRVPPGELAAALDRLDPGVRDSLTEAVRRVRAVHADQLPAGHRTDVAPGASVTQRWVPVERVGLYVPGGRAVYPSSVVMNVVPAQVAGVSSVAVASPAQREHGGLPHPTILAACALLGVDEVYAVGGAQAVAMFAHGYAGGPDGEDCPPVDLVTGPGNVYVTAAKRLLRGLIGIDSEAGPTEIAVLADDTADPAFVAADLVSQAEHDVLAAAVLVTPSESLARAVAAEVSDRAPRTKHHERIAESLSGPQSAIVLVDDLEAGMAVVDAYAAEHLEIHTGDARERALRVRNAGAVFVGPWTPVSLGDYVAGSNHVLPTGGCACHSAGLQVATFLRGVQVVEYDREALAGVAGHVVTLSHAEDLPAHGEAVTARVG